MNNSKISLTRLDGLSFSDSLKVMGNKVGDNWYHQPLYYREYKPGYYETFTYDELPEDIKQQFDEANKNKKQ